VIASQRLGKVSDGAVGQTLLAHGRLIVCGDDDNRQVNLCQREPPLQITTGQTRHLKVENQAVGEPLRQGIKKFLAAGVYGDLKATGKQHPCQSAPD